MYFLNILLLTFGILLCLTAVVCTNSTKSKNSTESTNSTESMNSKNSKNSTNSTNSKSSTNTTTQKSVPTIIDYHAFNLDDDLNKITECMKGKHGKNTRDIINVVTARSNAQRQQIRQKYTAGSKDLIKDLYEYAKSKKHPNFAKNLIDLFRTPIEYIASRITHELKAGGDYSGPTLLRLLVTVNSDEMEQAKQLIPSYAGMSFNELLTKSLIYDYVTLSCLGLGDPKYRSVAAADSKRTGEILSQLPQPQSKYDNDCGNNAYPAFARMMMYESYAQLKAVAESYNSQNKNTISDYLLNECGYYGEYYAVIFDYTLDSDAFFANDIHDWKNHVEDMESTGTRIVVQRSEIDLENIKEKYFVLFNSSMLLDFTSNIKDDELNVLIFQQLIDGNKIQTK